MLANVFFEFGRWASEAAHKQGSLQQPAEALGISLASGEKDLGNYELGPLEAETDTSEEVPMEADSALRKITPTPSEANNELQENDPFAE